ncbi:MAG: putative beta-lysine N-acetyltransferase [bacterium]
MPDVMERVHHSLIQHGRYNDRIYLVKLSKRDFPTIIGTLHELAVHRGYSKIFAKVPAYARDEFKHHEFRTEAFVPRFYHGREGVYFMGKYFSRSRQSEKYDRKVKQTLEIARSQSCQSIPKKIALHPNFAFRICDGSHAPQIAEVYRRVFDTYPFPIYDPGYIRKTIHDNVMYFSIWKGDNIIALSSTEMDSEAKNVEMTDFATLPKHRGNALASYLLKQMEHEMSKQGHKTAYTIARALSVGMNVTFAKMGYEYGGTLKNNTNICGQLESMNVWYKFLSL